MSETSSPTPPSSTVNDEAKTPLVVPLVPVLFGPIFSKLTLGVFVPCARAGLPVAVAGTSYRVFSA